MVIYLFRAEPVRFENALMEALSSARGGRVDWQPDPSANARECGARTGWIGNKGTVNSFFSPDPCADVARKLAKDLGALSVSILFQENLFWELLLHQDSLLKFKFSVAPGEWGEDAVQEGVGSIADLSRLWEVPIKNIERYFVDWKPREAWSPLAERMGRVYALDGQKAYPGDQYCYGDLNQGFDVIRALEGISPFDGKRVWLHMPPPPARPPR